MKRILKLAYACLFILLLPSALLSAQDKRSDQKIKIIVDDGSGSKVVIDTLITGDMKPDSLKLKDGTVIYLRHDGDGSYRLHPSENKHFFITYSSDSRSDSLDGQRREKYTVISRNSREHGERLDDRDSTVKKTKYVIAKDGMVVTVEGNDEARAKDLVKIIENELGVKLNP